MKIFYVCCFIIVAFSCKAQHKEKKPDIDKQSVINDIDYYQNAIFANHIDPFKYISKDEFTRQIKLIKSNSKNKNIDELVIELRQLNAKMKDEHSMIGGFRETKLFPIQYYWFEEGLFVINTNEKYKNLIYNRLIAINNVPIKTVIEKTATTLPNTGVSSIKDNIALFLTSTRVLHGLDIIDNIDSVTETFVTQQNDTVNVLLYSQNKEEVRYLTNGIEQKLLRYRKSGNYWFYFDKELEYIYLNYSQCLVDPNYPFDKFTKDFFKTLKEHSIKKVIIDLRDNTGGQRAVLKPFILELSKSQEINSLNVWVLIGRRTFSAGLNNVFDLAKMVSIKTVGEESGGNVNHFGQPNTYKLPNTGLYVSYSTNYIINKIGCEGPLIPDIIVRDSFSNYINGKDITLQYPIKH